MSIVFEKFLCKLITFWKTSLYEEENFSFFWNDKGNGVMAHYLVNMLSNSNLSNFNHS